MVHLSHPQLLFSWAIKINRDILLTIEYEPSLMFEEGSDDF